MNNVISILVGAAWLAIFAVLVWGIVTAWRRNLRDDRPLPLFRLLERQGLTLRQVEEEVGIEGLTWAASRCASCALRHSCESGVFGKRPVGCPNGRLFDRLARNRMRQAAA